MATTLIPTDLQVDGTITATSGVASVASGAISNAQVNSAAAIARTKLEQNALAKFVIPLTAFRVFDALQTNLPGTAAADDLGLIGGTFGTNSPTLQTSDLKAAGATNMRARCLVALPAEYDDGETVQIRVHGGMKTTVSDTTATVDIECYESDKEEGISADLCTTAAQDINSLTAGDDDFTITPTSLVSGDVLDIRVTVAINDGATGNAVIGIIGSIELLCDIKG
tara:strand:- start:1154 stop:1828 length:675 start_codon:yes stop_codon:yes gene_type:complete